MHPFTEAAASTAYTAAPCAPDTSPCPVDHLNLDGKKAIMPGKPAAVITHYHCPSCGWHTTTITAKPTNRRHTMTNVTDHDRLTVVKMLNADKTHSFIQAANTHLTLEDIRQIGQSHGYPDKPKMSWAIDVLERKIHDDQLAGVPKAEHAERIPVPAPASVSVSHPSEQHTLPTRGILPKDPTADLLTKAAESPKVRTRNLATKISDDLIRLRDMVIDDGKAERERLERIAAKEAERRKRQQEQEAARAEVEKAEAALKAARDKLRKFKHTKGGQGRATVNRSLDVEKTSAQRAAAGDRINEIRAHQAEVLLRHGVDAKDVRAWAIDTGLDCPQYGILPVRIVDAYDQAHTNQAAS